MYIVHEPEGKKILHSEEELASFTKGKAVVIAAGGMVYNDKGQLLMMFRRGQWDMPKGKLDEGESIEECALREVEEETGLTPLQLIKKLQVTYHTYHYKGKYTLKPSHWYLMRFHGEGRLIPQLEEDITDIKWVDKEEASKLILNAYPSIREMVEKYYLA